ncbi:MAG TPA: carboxypeptidase-like regulatory domain-containing protein [bacterium]|nr:carboxypeptidase-like regulatory domain-containing protein [bacterium]
MTGNTDLDSTSVPSGYVEGYIYALSQSGQRQGSSGVTIDNYTSLAEADVSISCSNSNKTGMTDTDGYYKIENVPVGNCVLMVSKSGYNSLVRNIEVTKETPARISYTIDGFVMGRILLENGIDHSGTTVTISQDKFSIEQTTNSQGIYILPDLGSFENGKITIEADNSCEFYFPGAISVRVEDDLLVSTYLPDIILLGLFKYTVTTDKSVYYQENGDILEACLTVEYRGTETIMFECNNPPPDLIMRHKDSGANYGIDVPLQSTFNITFSPERKYSGGCLDYDTTIFREKGMYRVFMWLGNEPYIPECASSKCFVPENTLLIEVK